MGMRLALVGLGKVARDQHVPALLASPHFELVCGAALEGRCPTGATYPSVEAMLEAEPAIDAVALCQPPQVRFQAARAALEAGKHVLLEKPPGATLAELEVLAQTARQHGLTLFAAWHSRYAPGVEPARRWLAGRRVVSARIDWREDVRVWHPGQHWIWQPGGLGVFDPGVNALSIATLLAPALRLVDARLFYPDNRQAPIAAELDLATSDGAAVKVDLDFRQTGAPTWEIHIETNDGDLRLHAGGSRLDLDGVEQVLPPEAEYPHLYARFAELIRMAESEVDARPLQLVADAFLRGARHTVDAFHEVPAPVRS